jgi:hypothetical protein
MAVKVKIDPIGSAFRVLFEDAVSPRARSKYLADFAGQKFAEAQRQNAQALGRVPPHETYVDGRRNAPLNSVRPDGTIIFEFELLEEVFAWIGEQLIKHSPVRSGRYRSSHAFIVDSVVIDPGAPLPLNFNEAVFVNVQPYARKIERGLSAQAPDGVFQVVAVLAASRFGNVAKIRFGYRTPLFGAINSWANKTTMASPSRRGQAREEWLRRQPAVVITPR